MTASGSPPRRRWPGPPFVPCAAHVTGQRSLCSLPRLLSPPVPGRQAVLVALAVVGVVAWWRWVTTTGSARRRAASAITTAGVAVAPAVLLFGWFYVRNVILYGDVGASHYLMDWFGRRPTGGVIEVLLDGGMWLDIYQALATRSLLSIPATGRATFVADVAALVVVAGLVAVAVRRPRRWCPEHGTGRAGLTTCAAVVAVTAATIAQHVAGGGLPSSRYVFPALGVLACLFVIGAEVVAPRVLPVVVVAVLVTWTGHVVPGRVAAAGRPRSWPRAGRLGRRRGHRTARCLCRQRPRSRRRARHDRAALDRIGHRPTSRPHVATRTMDLRTMRPCLSRDTAAPPEGTSADICQSRSDAGAKGLDGFQPGGTVGGAR